MVFSGEGFEAANLEEIKDAAQRMRLALHLGYQDLLCNRFVN